MKARRNSLRFLVRRRLGQFRHFDFRQSAKFGTDRVGGKAGAKKGAIERGELAFVERAAHLRQAALQARPHQSALVQLLKNRRQRRFDVTVREAASAQIARDAEATLTTCLRVAARVVERVAGVVQIIVLLEPLEHRPHAGLILGAALEQLTHLVDRMRTAHQRTQRDGVELRFRRKLAGGMHAQEA